MKPPEKPVPTERTRFYRTGLYSRKRALCTAIVPWALAFTVSTPLKAAPGDAPVTTGQSAIVMQWQREGSEQAGIASAFIYRPIEQFNFELSVQEARNKSASSPSLSTQGNIKLDWWPVTTSSGLKLGLSTSIGQQRERDSDDQISLVRISSGAVNFQHEFDPITAEYSVQYLHAESGPFQQSAWGSNLSLSLGLTSNVELDVGLARSQGESAEITMALTAKVVSQFFLSGAVSRNASAISTSIGFGYVF